MNSLREKAIELLKDYQLKYLKLNYGAKYKIHLKNINNKSNFNAFITEYVNSKDDLTDIERRNLLFELNKEISSSILLITEYESFAIWKILKSTHDKFTELNPDLTVNGDLYLGTILSNEISAGTTFEKDLDALFILFDGEFINIALQLSKIIAQSIPLSEKEPHIIFPIDIAELYNNICRSNSIKERIIGGLYFSIYKKPTDFPAYSLDSDLQEYISSMLIESIEYFVFSHEMGHYFNGHLTGIKEDLDFAAMLKKDWEEEFEADLFGLNKIVELYKSTNKVFSLLGADIFFNFLILREKYDTRIKDDISHPPATERLKTHRIFLSNFLNETELENLAMHQAIIDSLFKYYEIIVNNFVNFKKTNGL